jgi:hypothetical protein
VTSLPGGEDEGLAADDILEEQEAAEAVQGSGLAVARLPGQSGYLIVDGPGAGSVTGHSAGSRIREAAAVPGRDEALDGTLPLFIVHRTYQHWRPLPRLLAQLHATAGASIALGVASPVSKASEQSHADFNASCAAAAVRIVDPQGYLADSKDVKVEALSPRSLRWAPHLGADAVPTASLLDMQRARGANLLLTPGGALDPADPQRSLDAACHEADDALAALKPGERLALNLTMSAAWLTRPALLDTLLDQLIDQEQFDTWHIRVQLPAAVRPPAQPSDARLLAGYRQLAELAAGEDRRLLLPHTGLTGWLMLAYGTAGFGTGLSGSHQAFTEPAGGGKPGAPRVERYFERQLLHTIEQTSRAALAGDPNYARCQCAYCRPLLGGPSWNHEYAGLHYLFSVGTLAAEVAAPAAGRGGTHGAVSRKVRSALAFARGKALTGSSAPAHLSAWDQLL